MKFTYLGYERLISIIKENGYRVSDYEDERNDRIVVLRHDVDYCLSKSLPLAEIENRLGIRSTYFLMLTNDFYNVFSKRNSTVIRKLILYGHDVGLHFDEMRYPDYLGDVNKLTKMILLEAQTLSEAIGKNVNKVSMHRPSREILEANISIPGFINTYDKKYFVEYKYLSDSRRRWREPVEEILASKKYKKLQILTHPFWYENEETGLPETITKFLDDARLERYHSLQDNMTNLNEIMHTSVLGDER